MSYTRQLAAIMFTDIQGYTAMMQHDEEIAIKFRDRHRRIFNLANEKFGGTILQYFGDGTLSTFKSAIDAVHCAMEMQMEFQKQPVIPVRIGIHMGDIVVTGDDIIGDGVNIASRIESLAVPGSILISSKVFDEIKNQPSIEATSLKIVEFKNVDVPVEVFAISNKGMIVPEAKSIRGKTKDEGTGTELQEEPVKRKLKWLRYLVVSILLLSAVYFVVQYLVLERYYYSLSDKSIAVLPFVNMTDDPNQEYFSDGITEDILTHLSRVADLRVVSRTSTIQYKNTTKTIPQIARELCVSTVLEGSVRKHGDMVRITAQLIDAETDEHIWAESYDREVTKIFDIQTEVATEIIKALKAKLTENEKESIEKPLTSEITAYDYYLRGMEALKSGETLNDFENANILFDEAIKEDPEFAAAYAGLAWAVVAMRSYGVYGEFWIDTALALNQKALELDPDHDEANYLQGYYYMWTENYPQAKYQFEKVLQLNPNHYRAMIQLGEVLLLENEYDEGIELVIEGWLRQLNKKEPEFYMKMGDVYSEIREYDKSKKFYQEALKLKPDSYWAYYALVELSVSQKDYSEALVYARHLVDIEQNIYSLDRLGWACILNKQYDQAIDAWEKLGEMQSGTDSEFFNVAYKHRLAYALWQTGRKEEANRLFEEQIQQNIYIIENEVKTDVAGEAYDLAGIYSFLGEEEEAMKWIRISKEKDFFPLTLIDRDPLLDNLRSNEEFRQMVEKQRIEEEQFLPKFDQAKKKIRELEERGVLTI